MLRCHLFTNQVDKCEKILVKKWSALGGRPQVSWIEYINYIFKIYSFILKLRESLQPLSLFLDMATVARAGADWSQELHLGCSCVPGAQALGILH